MYVRINSKTSIARTPLGPLLTVLFVEVSLLWGGVICLYIRQCMGCQMGLSRGGCISEVSFARGFAVNECT